MRKERIRWGIEINQKQFPRPNNLFGWLLALIRSRAIRSCGFFVEETHGRIIGYTIYKCIDSFRHTER